MKAIAVTKRHGRVPSRHRTQLPLEKGIEKPTKDYERHLGCVLSQAKQPMSQDLWVLDVLNRQNIISDGFQVIAAEAARLSHRRRRNTITRTDICSAIRVLHPTQCQGCPMTDVPTPETCNQL